MNAIGKLGEHDIEAEVINPGGWFGKTWLVEIGCGYSSVFYVVEADSVTDAIDEFIDSEPGKRHVVIPPEDYGDYGLNVYPGDQIGGRTFTEKGKVNLRGEFFPNGSEHGTYLSEPYHGDGGVYADIENLMCHGQERTETPWKCEYIVPGVEEPVPSTRYGQPTYTVTRDEHDGETAGFKSERDAEDFIDGKVAAGEGKGWEWNIIEVPFPYPAVK